MKLKVFGLMVPVIIEDGLAEKGFAGYYDPNTKEIHIDSGLTGYAFEHTRLHELIHSVADRTGILQTGVSLEVMELICENVSTAILENYNIKLKRLR